MKTYSFSYARRRKYCGGDFQTRYVKKYGVFVPPTRWYVGQSCIFKRSKEVYKVIETDQHYVRLETPLWPRGEWMAKNRLIPINPGR